MVQQAGIVALCDGEPFVSELRAAYTARRQQALSALSAISGVTLVSPDGAFYVFLKVGGMDDSIAFAERLVRDGGLALTPGVAFGKHGEGFLRLCFASSEPIVLDAIDRFSRFMTANPSR
jgi:aspartate aminotransferase